MLANATAVQPIRTAPNASVQALQTANSARAHQSAGTEANQIAELGDLTKYDLPLHLRAVAEARRDNPELSIARLGAHLGMSKDTCSGRLRRFWEATGRLPSKHVAPVRLRTKRIDPGSNRELTAAQQKVLAEFLACGFAADVWVRPMDISSQPNSYRSTVLAQLEQRGYVESQIRSAATSNLRRLYRLTTAGRNHATRAALRRCAAGSYPKEAAVELLIGALSGELASWDRPWIVTEGSDSWIDSHLIPAELSTVEPGEPAAVPVLEVVTALLQGCPVNICDIVTQSDRGHLALILAALAHAGGMFSPAVGRANTG